ncbi:sciellin isoform X14 [Anguilla rostrata]|uniref:sciellin isoform X14 n=1 Tax=Anguilla rostrata TaxID=7938 RepID=UPI0030CB27EE
MSYAYPKSFVPKTDVKTGSPSKAIEDSKKKTNLLKDNSWIKKNVEEDEPVDDDPNFGKVVLSRLKSNEYPDEKSSDNDTSNTGSSGTPKSSSTSVQSITKKFSGTQEVKSSAPPSYDKAIASKSVNTKVSADGKTTETTETTITTSRTAATKQTFSERVFSDVKSPSKPTYSSSSPTSSTTTTTRTRSVSSPRPSETTTVTSYTDPAKDKPLDVLADDFISMPSSSAYSSQDRDYSRTYSSSSPNSSTITTTRTRSVSSPRPSETTTVTSYTETVKDREYRTYSPSPDSITRNIRTYSSSEYSPSVRTSSYSSLNSEPSYTDGLYKSRSYTSLPRETSYEYSSLSSPSSYTKTSYLESSPSGSYSDLVSMKSSSSVYASPDRAITAKDICTYCNKPMSIDPKMILDDLQIHCHATCFKCEVCSTSLGHLKAGDTMWIYRRTVHCERCFETTRDKWRR